MHNELWGSAEIMANVFETIVFVNTLHPLTEAFLAFFLGLLLPPIQFAFSVSVCSRTHTTPNLITSRCCLAKDRLNINKDLNISAQLLFCSFDLFFCHIFVSIILMVCSRSL